MGSPNRRPSRRRNASDPRGSKVCCGAFPTGLTRRRNRPSTLSGFRFGQPLLVRAHNHEPEHGRQLSHPEWHPNREGYVLVLREQEACKAEPEVAKATDYQPDAEEAGKEARSVDEQTEGNEPNAPEDRVGEVEVVMQVEEQHGEG